LTTAIPRGLLARNRLESRVDEPLGVGVIFLPVDDSDSRSEIEAAIAAQDR
jgi:hypothetical protein